MLLEEELTLLHGRGGRGIKPVLKARLTRYLLQRPSLASLCRGKCFLLHASPVLHSLEHGWGYLLRRPPAPTDWAFPRLELYLPLSPPATPTPGAGRVDTTKCVFLMAPLQRGLWTHLPSLLSWLGFPPKQGLGYKWFICEVIPGSMVRKWGKEKAGGGRPC